MLNDEENKKMVNELKNSNDKHAKTKIEKLTHSEFVININPLTSSHRTCMDIVSKIIINSLNNKN